MAKGKSNLNSIYIFRRMEEYLRPISHYALTTVTAPMGYGKTTAVNWFLTQKMKREQAIVIRISIYSDNILYSGKAYKMHLLLQDLIS